MAVNFQPIFRRLGDVSSNNGIVSTANMAVNIITATGDYTGVSTNYRLVFTSDATNGSFIERLRFKSRGTNVPTVARVFVNNGGDQTIAVNNAFYGEVNLPSVTAVTTTSTIDLDYYMNFALPPGFRIYVGVATTLAAGWNVMAVGGKY